MFKKLYNLSISVAILPVHEIVFVLPYQYMLYRHVQVLFNHFTTCVLSVLLYHVFACVSTVISAVVLCSTCIACTILVICSEKCTFVSQL